ncbi:hypothetical protein E4U42_001200 [Claviceps africana]|uniref:Uncharacterized protein n=1 Tax=Claviceps africana TaxID=83212 RepID=A0A8K0NJC3_9HYPO|nr:hypothetical protein E4U42_001200 [Claviceps africana]
MAKPSINVSPFINSSMAKPSVNVSPFINSSMANRPSRKRKSRHDVSQDDRALKKPTSKSRGRFATPFAPAFYDQLSKIPLTLNVLKELNTRNEVRNEAANRAKQLAPLPKTMSRFARGGGPNLQHLIQKRRLEAEQTGSGRQSQPAGPANPISGTKYGKEFEQHLQDHIIYFDDSKSTPLNIEELRAKLRECPSLSSSTQFSQEQFIAFKATADAAVFKRDVMANVVPYIFGNSNILCKQNILFTELASITNDNVPRPKPSHFDGQHLLDLNMEVRNNYEIRRKVIPTQNINVPVAMNFFMESGRSEGHAMVGKRKACYFGAYGARAMNCLQNYGKAQPEYDGNAYTFTSVYQASAGLLHLYAHHVTAPRHPGGREEYHMTLIKRWLISDDLESFQSGVLAFRYARLLAQEYRVRFVQAANARHDGRQ